MERLKRFKSKLLDEINWMAWIILDLDSPSATARQSNNGLRDRKRLS